MSPRPPLAQTFVAPFDHHLWGIWKTRHARYAVVELFRLVKVAAGLLCLGATIAALVPGLVVPYAAAVAMTAGIVGLVGYVAQNLVAQRYWNARMLSPLEGIVHS